MNAKRMLSLLLIVVLVVGGTAAVALAAPTTAEIEPNDTMGQATPITLGETMATNNSIDDVDYFSLELTAGQTLYLAAESCVEEDLWYHLSLYDGGGNLLAEDSKIGPRAVIPAFTAPATGTYYIRYTNQQGAPFEVMGDYTLFTALHSAGEQANSEENPTPIAFGETVDGLFDWPSDYDYFVFEGLAGQVADISFEINGTEYIDFRVLSLDSDDLHAMARLEQGHSQVRVVLPTTGRYSIFAWYPELCDQSPNTPMAYQLSLERMSLYVAGLKQGKASGVSFGTNDILANDASGAWQKVFDGEDVGLTAQLGGFEMMSDGSILISLKKAQVLGTLGKVLPQDIVRFVPTTLGETTAGQFEWYLKGNQVGLTTAKEAIDAIALTTGGDLLISTLGAASVPQQGGGTLNGADEDLLRFHPAGAWSLYFDGNDVARNLNGQNVGAAAIVLDDNQTGSWTADLLLTLNKNYRLLNHTGWPTTYVQVAKGDLIGFDDTLNILLPQVKRADFGFPKPITGLSVGPAWGEATPPPGGDGASFTPSDDTFVNSAKPTTKYGGNPSIKVKDAAADMNSYLKFNVSGLSGAVESATLRLYVTDAGPDGGSVYAVSNEYSSGGAWTEGGLTWNNAPAISGVALDSVGAANNGQWVELDVTAAVAGNGTYSFALRNGNKNIVFYSSKEGVHSPELVITTE